MAIDRKKREDGALCRASYASPIGGIVLAAREGHGLIGLWFEGQKYFLGSIREELTEREELPVFAQTRQWLDRYFAGERPGIGEIDLAPEGSAFAKRVWTLLREIPYGETTTYGRIAAQIAQERGAAGISVQTAADTAVRISARTAENTAVRVSARTAGDTVVRVSARTAGDTAVRVSARTAGDTAVRVSAQAVGGAVAHNPISIIIPCHRVIGSNGSLTGYAGGIDKKLWLLRHEGADLSHCFVPGRGNGQFPVSFDKGLR